MLPALACLVAVGCLGRTASALQVTFPGGPAHWVSCKHNVLQWTSSETDPASFSVQLLNANRSLLNGNYQIGNAIATSNGTALLTPNCVEPANGYYLALVNASNYELGHPQVFYQSPAFEIEPNTSTVPTPAGTALVHNGTVLQTTSGEPSAGANATILGGAAKNASSEVGKEAHENGAARNGEASVFWTLAALCLGTVAGTVLVSEGQTW